jgi:hypothetical protein
MLSIRNKCKYCRHCQLRCWELIRFLINAHKFIIFYSAKNAAKVKNDAADAFAKAKTTNVSSKLRNTNYIFVPLIAETFGSWSDSSVNQINDLIKYYAAYQKIALPLEYGPNFLLYCNVQMSMPSNNMPFI